MASVGQASMHRVHPPHGSARSCGLGVAAKPKQTPVRRHPKAGVHPALLAGQVAVRPAAAALHVPCGSAPFRLIFAASSPPPRTIQVCGHGVAACRRRRGSGRGSSAGSDGRRDPPSRGRRDPIISERWRPRVAKERVSEGYREAVRSARARHVLERNLAGPDLGRVHGKQVLRLAALLSAHEARHGPRLEAARAAGAKVLLLPLVDFLLLERLRCVSLVTVASSGAGRGPAAGRRRGYSAKARRPRGATPRRDRRSETGFDGSRGSDARRAVATGRRPMSRGVGRGPAAGRRRGYSEEPDRRRGPRIRAPAGDPTRDAPRRRVAAPPRLPRGYSAKARRPAARRRAGIGETRAVSRGSDARRAAATIRGDAARRGYLGSMFPATASGRRKSGSLRWARGIARISTSNHYVANATTRAPRSQWF